jgi:hypothetical protein
VKRSLIVLSAACAALAACTHTIDVKPIEVKPIHMTMDINLKVQRELSDFFGYEDELRPRVETQPTSAPAEGEKP